MLEVKNLGVSYGSLNIVDDVSFTLGAREWLMIVGPNGAGKSTLVGAVSRGVPYRGTVTVNGEDTARIKPARLARLLGVLSQTHSVGYSFSVEEVVSLGRYSRGRAERGGDDDAVTRALEMTGMAAQRRQSVLTLSGGEVQRTFLAQLFAQDPEILILDEPTNHLDLVYQKQIFALIRDWIDETGRSVVSVVHDLSLARAYGTSALLMNRGHTVAFGEARGVLTRERLSAVYGMDVYEWMHTMLSQWQD